MGPHLDYSAIIRQGWLHRHSRGGGTVDGTHNLHSLAAFIPGDGRGPTSMYRLDEILDLQTMVFGVDAHGILWTASGVRLQEQHGHFLRGQPGPLCSGPG